ncbi:hypothetical protein AU375_03240 [Methylobacterium radiotolerans]|nr:hypothetical protein AU375_03240 [Methylobacterium radiotolerans]
MIHVASATEDCPAWRQAAGTAELPSADTLHVDTFAMAIQAAAAGLGVALGRGAPMERDRRDGTLVGVDPAVAAATSRWLISAEGVDDRQEADRFRTRMRAEASRFAAEQKARYPLGRA